MSNANSLELEMLALINAEREAEGLGPLRLITLLNDAAEAHSQWMLENNQFSHEGENGSSPSARIEDAGYPFEGNSLSAENIGWQSERGEDGASDDVAQIHQGLMESEGHRANILNPDAEDIGIGVEIGTYSTPGGDFEAIMVTQVFGKTEADLSAWIDPLTGEDDPTPPPVEEPEEPVDETPDEEPTAEDPVDEQPTDDTPDTEDPVEEPDEEQPTDDPVDMPMADIPLPCDLTEFTVDLSSAFEYRQEGDQLIWETSEEKLMETFMAAFEEWAATAPVEGDEMADLWIDDMPEDQANCGEQPEETDDWFYETCA